MNACINFLTEQNEWTLFIFIASLIIDVISAYHVDKVVHQVELYVILLATIVFNIIISVAYLSQGALYNISPIISMITILLLCYSLVKINRDREKELEGFKEQLKNKKR